MKLVLRWGAAALPLILLGLLPLRAEAVWDENGFSLGVGFSFLPARPAGRKSRKGKEDRPSKKMPSPPILKILAKNGYTTLCYIVSRVKVEELTVRFTAAGPDPAAAAAAYAAAALAMDALSALGGGRLAESDLRADVDFDAEKPKLLAHIRLRLRVYRLLWAGARFGLGFLGDIIRYKKGKDK